MISKAVLEPDDSQVDANGSVEKTLVRPTTFTKKEKKEKGTVLFN